MMDTIVKIQRLRKEFGLLTAVNDISFEVKKGEVLGFLGPNGAGKSTTMKMITGFLTPTSGTVSVDGFDITERPLEVKKRIGYLPEGAPAYPDMTPLSFLNFIGDIRGLSSSQKLQRIDDVVSRVNLESVLYQPIDTLSKGFKRRVGLAQAILHDPEVLILDEPTDGLDPNQKHEVRSLITQMAEEKVIILSTHILEEVHAVCSRAIIIANGKVLADGTPNELESESPNHNAVTITVKKTDNPSAVRETLLAIPNVHKLETLEESDVLSYRLQAKSNLPIVAEVSQTAYEKQWEMLGLSVESGQLDEVFRTITTTSSRIN
ncbi:ABC transporter ATP-binding protein [Candidatus Albibeggiatoa sp. nov. NOAA]|uniref:ABC transporter ATP-binding protein n=1 Tax=Candidatus Albibeggiatoa sp. nov. NOAA TaxID=3162724 RepID=UPI00333F8A23